MAAFLRSLGKFVVLSAPPVVTFADLVASVTPLSGNSMEPTLNPGNGRDFVLLDKTYSRDFSYTRGDVVYMRSPCNASASLVTRIVALEGDWVAVPDQHEIVLVPKGHCWVEGDNQRLHGGGLAASHAPAGMRALGGGTGGGGALSARAEGMGGRGEGGWQSAFLPAVQGRGEGEVLEDSNVLGPVPLALIEARVSHVVWPPSRFARVRSVPPQGRVVACKPHSVVV
eukprot:jgi/Mesvir1/27788/Mv07469-RA.1